MQAILVQDAKNTEPVSMRLLQYCPPEYMFLAVLAP